METHLITCKVIGNYGGLNSYKIHIKKNGGILK